jgi:hypothetical protein
VSNKRAWTDEQLRAAVASSTSYASLQTNLGLKRGGGTHYDLKRRVADLDLDTSHFVQINSRPWADDQLRAAVAASTSYPMALRQLNVPLSGSSEQKARRHARLLGIDTTHFRRQRGPVPRAPRWTDDQLRVAVVSSRSYAHVIRQLGLVPAGGNYDQVQRRIATLELDTSHFTGMRWNVGLRMPYRPTLPLDEVLVKDRWVTSHNLKQRLFREGLKQPRCEICGWATQAPDGRVPVELDHINGDKTDNRLENLRIVCPNCHALQPTHRGLNKKSRRK